jgi:hypothetical protein
MELKTRSVRGCPVNWRILLPKSYGCLARMKYARRRLLESDTSE